MIAEWLNLAFALAVFALFFGAVRKTRHRKRPIEPVPDGPETEQYQVYTAEFDVELRAKDLGQKLFSISPDYMHGRLKLGKLPTKGEVELADRMANESRQKFIDALGDSSFEDRAFTLLVDQSGSMKDEPIRWAYVGARLAVEVLCARGAKVEILGFSTGGWQGGFAYQKWKANRGPARPGRLCALLHIIYKDSAEDLDIESLQAMLNPNILRENVDGEALMWAARRLLKIEANSRNLIVLSDGAPVDDATMLHNGTNYLVRHLTKVISELEGNPSLQLCAIGVRYPVDRFYCRSSTVDDLAEFPGVLARSLRNLASPQ